MKLIPFDMERWQSTYEHRVDYNLSESGVHPLTVGELLEFADGSLDLSTIQLGYGQSNGSDELRETIASLYPGASDRSVVVTTGGAEANFAAFWYLANPGTPVAVMLPNYMQIPGLIKNFGGEVIPFHLKESEGWRVDLDELETALKRGAGFIVVTNPNNPTGVALTGGEMDRIVELAGAHGAWILSDEVYQGAERQGPPVETFWGRYDKVIVTNSLSKAYGMPGVRLGWAIGPEDVIEDLWARRDYITIAPPSVSDALARVVLSDSVRPRLLARTQGIVRRNFQVMASWMDSHDGLFGYTPPDAGAICMVRYQAPVDSLTLAQGLRTEHSLLIVPGAHFGIESTMRLGFGPPEDELVQALDRLGAAFTAVQAA